MKTRILTLALLLSIAVYPILHSCKKIKELTSFDVTKTIPDIPVPIVQTAETNLIEKYYEFPVYINLDSIKKANNVSNFTILNGKVTEAKLAITSPAGANLAFLHAVRITLLNTISDELQVAHSGIIDPTANSYQLIPDGTDIKTFLTAQHFKGRFYYIVDNAALPAPIVYLGLYFTLKFTVSPF